MFKTKKTPIMREIVAQSGPNVLNANVILS